MSKRSVRGASEMELWELQAREAVRDTMAQYTHAGDRFPLEGLADSFCVDAVLEVSGQTTVTGRDAIADYRMQARAASGGLEPDRLLRHNVANICFDAVSHAEIRTSSYYTVFTEIGVDHMGRYFDVFRPVDDRWLISK